MWQKLLASSADPKDLSLTVKGILVGIVPFAMLIINAAGAKISQDELRQLVEVITDSVAAFSTLVSSLMVLVGVARKLWNAAADL